MNAPIRFTVPSIVANAEFIIFCVGQDAFNIESFKGYAELAGLDLQELTGSYKGEVEVSFITHASNWRQIAPWVQDEESVLVLGARTTKRGQARPASLYFVDSGEEVDLGILRQVSEREAKSLDAWTYNPEAKAYFAAE